MCNALRVVAIATVACLPVAAAAADIYKCINAKGNVEYQQAPCSKKDTGKMLDIPDNYNSIDGSVDPRIAEQQKAWDEKMAKQRQERAQAAEQASMRDDAYYAYCQPFIDQIRRSSVWLNSPKEIEREAAANDIRIARRRLADANCRENMPPRY